MNHNYSTVIASIFIAFVGISKISAQAGPEFLQCSTEPLSLSIQDEEVRLPANNQIFLGEEHPDAISCSVHVTQSTRVRSTCGANLQYEVHLFLDDTSSALILKANTSIETDSSGEAELFFNTEESPEEQIRLSGIPYTTGCQNYHTIKWIVRDSCSQEVFCGSRIELKDNQSPILTNPGFFIVPISISGELTLVAKEYMADILDDCTASEDFVASLVPDRFLPDSIYDPCEMAGFGVPLLWNIWIGDQGIDMNCDGEIDWQERNIYQKEFTLVIQDNFGIHCGGDPFISGRILTVLQDGVGEVTVSIESPGFVYPTAVTDADGKYFFGFFPLSPFTLVPFRDDNHRNGVSTLDIVRLQKHLLGREIFTSPYQYIAADANNSQNVSAIDLVEIRKLILGLMTRFPNNQSWRFIPKDHTFEFPYHPWPFNETIEIIDPFDPVVYDFTGVKIGDVNFTAAPNFTSLSPREARPIALWTTTQKYYGANEIIEIPFYLNSSDNIQGFQFTIASPDLEFLDISSGAILISNDETGFFKDKVTLSWYDLDGIQFTEGEPAFTIRARTTSKGNVKSNLQINSDITTAELFTVDEDLFLPALRVIESNETGTLALPPEPNPWKGHTVIPFYLEEAGAVSFEIFNLHGQSIYTRTEVFGPGYNALVLYSDEIIDRGLLLYSLSSGLSRSTQKMFVLD